MTRAEKIAELAEKAKRMREKAAQLDNEKRRILRAEEKAQRAIDTRWKIIYGAAVMKAGLTGQLSQHISAKDREWMASHPMSQPKPKAAEPQKPMNEMEAYMARQREIRRASEAKHHENTTNRSCP